MGTLALGEKYFHGIKRVPQCSHMLLLLLFFLTFSVLVANLKNLLYTVANLANSARGLLNRKKRRSLAAPLPPPRYSFGENKMKITRRIYIPRRYAGLDLSRVRTRIPSTRRLGLWVSLRKTLRFRVGLQLSQSRYLSLLLTISSRVYLFFPSRGHEPPPTLRDRPNSHLTV